jgi:outer membrane protein OmpA-like peptidoglycan-associated protein
MHKLVLLFFFLTFTASAWADDRQIAKSLFEQAITIGTQNPAKTEQLLNKSLTTYPSFNAHYTLGLLHLDLGKLKEAEKDFNNAMSLTTNQNNLALCKARLGLVEGMSGNLQAGINLLKQAEELHSTPPSWMVTNRKKFDIQTLNKTMSSKAIHAELNQAVKSFKVVKREGAPSINIRINFQPDRAELDAKGIEQIHQLAEALQHEQWASYRFRVIGHTDSTGTSLYNQQLSEKRAHTVVDTLSTLLPKYTKQFTAVGKGESDLLYTEHNEEDKKLNRRVELEAIKL